MKEFTKSFVSVLTARNAVAPSRDIEIALKKAQRFEKALDSVFTTKDFDSVGQNILKRAAIADAKQDRNGFLAVKVLVKIVNIAICIGQKNTAELDGFTDTIAKNMIALGEEGISTKTNYVCLSKSVEYTETDMTQKLVARRDCTVGTASTQASSTRQALAALGIATIEKSKKGDIMTLKSVKRVNAFLAMFKAKLEDSDTEESDDNQETVTA